MLKRQGFIFFPKKGTLYVSGNGALQSNKITVNLTFRVSAGVFGAFTETFILPVTEP